MRMKVMPKMMAVVEKSAGKIKIRVRAMAPSGKYRLLNKAKSLGFANHRASQTSSANEAKAEV